MVENTYVEAKAATHVGERVGRLAESLTPVAHVAEKVVHTYSTSRLGQMMGWANAASDKAGDLIGSATTKIGGLFGQAPVAAAASSPIADQTLSAVGTMAEKVGGYAPLLVTVGDGARAVANIAQGNMLKGAVNVTSGAAKVAAVTMTASLSLPAMLGIEGLSWIAFGESSLTKLGKMVEHVFGETGEVKVAEKATMNNLSSNVASVSINAPAPIAKTASGVPSIKQQTTVQQAIPAGRWQNYVTDRAINSSQSFGAAVGA